MANTANKPKQKFQKVKRKKYFNSPIRWFRSAIEIAEITQIKHDLFDDLHEELKKRLFEVENTPAPTGNSGAGAQTVGSITQNSGVGAQNSGAGSRNGSPATSDNNSTDEIEIKGIFNRFLLQSYSECRLKMQKNKIKHFCYMKLWVFLKAVLSIGTAITFIIEAVRNTNLVTDTLISMFTSHVAQEDADKAADFWRFLGITGIIFATFLLIFIFYKLITISMNVFKPKETWIRHNKLCYKMSMEISDYLDLKGEYNTTDEMYAYEIFRENIKKLWEENLKVFWNAMQK